MMWLDPNEISKWAYNYCRFIKDIPKKENI